jgi:hypothetical protein
MLKHLGQHDRYMTDRSAYGIEVSAAIVRHKTVTPYAQEPGARALSSSLAATCAAR